MNRYQIILDEELPVLEPGTKPEPDWNEFFGGRPHHPEPRIVLTDSEVKRRMYEAAEWLIRNAQDWTAIGMQEKLQMLCPGIILEYEFPHNLYILKWQYEGKRYGLQVPDAIIR
jgi:hypothetical protein